MATLTQHLADGLEDDGVPVHLQHTLDMIDIPSITQQPMKLHFKSPSGAVTILARRVVLALPRRSIEAIRPLSTHPNMRSVLEAVEPWPVTTTALVYSDCWWSKLGFIDGRTVTDLPARLMRYHPAKPRDHVHKEAGAITFYADGPDANYWGSLVGPGWFASDHPVARAMHAQVLLVYQQRLGQKLPEPLCSYVQDWAGEPSGGAFHLWAAGSRPARARAVAIRPIDNIALHVWAKHGRSIKVGLKER